ncbi:MAG: aldehyde dehydrogenase family protein, partial [Microvirga sp.]
MREVGHFIGGKQVPGKSGRTTEFFQPMTGEVLGRVALASKDELHQAVENAKAAQPAWAATNPQRRARVMMKFLELIAKETDTLAEMLAREHGKTIPDAKGDIQRGVEVAEFCTGIPHLLKGEFTEGAGPGIDMYSIRQPLGVVAGITPFNFPAMVPMWMWAPALACGNTFVLKPSEKDPSASLLLAELVHEAGFPDGVHTVLQGDAEAVDALLTHPDVDAVSFVGSTAIARHVYETGAKHGKRVQALGGAKNL